MQTTEPVRELLARYLAEQLVVFDAMTKMKHEIAIRCFERVLGKDATLEDLTNGNLARMMSSLATAGKKRPTINGYRAKLVALWTWACKQGWIKTWPCVKKLPEPKRVPTAWTLEQIGILWSHLETLTGFIAGIPASLFWKIYVATGLETGERHGARMKLEWAHFTDFDRGTGVFPAEIRKGKRADMPFAISLPTIGLLREARELGAWRPLPWTLNEMHFFAKYSEVLRSAGLPSSSQHLGHCLRRTFATLLVQSGSSKADASEALGHADPTVIDLYVDGSAIRRPAAHSLFRKPWDIDPQKEPPRAA